MTEKEGHGMTGVKASLAPGGAGIWLAVWLLMPSPGKVAELRGEDAAAPSPPGSRSCCGNPAARPKTPLNILSGWDLLAAQTTDTLRIQQGLG